MRLNFSIRFMLLSVLGILNVLVAVLVGISVYKSWRNLELATTLKASAEAVNLLYEANNHLSIARGATLSVMHTSSARATIMQETIHTNLQLYDEKTSRAFSYFKQIRGAPTQMAQIEEQKQKLQNLYEILETELDSPAGVRTSSLPGNIYKASTDLIWQINGLITDLFLLLDTDSVIARHRIFKNFAWQLAEYAGQEYALIGRLIVEQLSPTPEQRKELLSLRERIRYARDIVYNFPLDGELKERLSSAMAEAQTHYFVSFESIKDYFYLPMETESAVVFPLGIQTWLELSSQAVDSLLALEDAVRRATQQHVIDIEESARNEIMASLALFFGAAILTLYCWWIVIFRVTRPVNVMVDALLRATKGEKYDLPRMVYGNDEIGKLAVVLKAFQDNMFKLKQSNEELEQFAYIASHDLKAPLRGIDNLTQWIEEDLEEVMTDNIREKLDLMRNRVNRLENLLEDILQYSRIGRVVDDSEEINVRNLIENLVPGMGIPETFAVNISGSLPVLSAPRTPLEQIFLNLISNAVKHHDKDHGIIEINAIDRGTNYEFVVKDDGPGIPEEFHGRVFKMFQTLQSRDKTEGSGLGMAIIKKLVEWQGGTVWIVSKDGERGTEVHFTWPKKFVTQVRKKDAA